MTNDQLLRICEELVEILKKATVEEKSEIEKENLVHKRILDIIKDGGFSGL
jgi:hypothetical protein